MKKILIFGSCVTRDPFENPIAAGSKFEIKDYYARSSFASLAGNPVLDGNLSKISSPFQRKMVEKDFSKNFLDYDFSLVDLILFDFIDDRFPLLELSDGSSCTESDEFKKSDLVFSHRKIHPFTDEFFEKWEQGWVNVLSRIKLYNALDRVLVNKVFLADIDDLGVGFEHQSYISRVNEWLYVVYERLFRDIPSDQFVSYIGTPFIASHNHKWGRSPFHFYNKTEIKFIKFIVNSLD